MEFYSHKGESEILLKYHLKVVGDNCRSIILSKSFSNIDKNVIAEISYLTGIAHDFGKYTEFFQEKLDGLRDDSLANHGLISAFFSFFLTEHYLKSKSLLDKRPFKFLPLLSFFIVKHHHGNLNDIVADTNPNSLFKSGFSIISKQITNIFQNQDIVKKEYFTLLNDFDISIDDVFLLLKPFSAAIDKSEEIKIIIKNNIGIQSYNFKKENDITYYLLTQLLYSALIDSDKKHAGNIRKIQRQHIPIDLIDKHLNQEEFQQNNKSNINNIRNEIRLSVLKNINIENKIFTLTAPTGTGKTLTSMSAALRLRDLLKGEFGTEPRIIYSLPFTSIIDQTYDVFERILSQTPDFQVAKNEYLLKHHYLSDIFYKASTDKEKLSVEESLALVESWESEIIVTTFIQLFHTLIGNKNKSLKKFHNIVNSIVILDEIQNIPIEYWALVRKVLISLTNYFNCRIILMTATKPLIFNEGEYNELVDNYQDYFKTEELNRVTIKPDNSKTVDELVNNVVDNLTHNSYLFVFNTINSSLEFYNKLKSKQGYKIFYLSTNIIPKERNKRIEKIKTLIKKNKKKDKKNKFIVITTQLIEAGVDIDCDVAYRDLSTIDSIVQVAGRCNRNNRLKNADVFITQLKDEKKEYSSYIYSPVLLKTTKEILNNTENIQEKDFLNIINQYFEKSKKHKGSNTDFIKSIEKLYFDDENCNSNPVSCFKLIKEDYIKYDVFVEIDKNAQKVWKKFIDLKNIENSLERKNEFYKFKKDFYDYIISLPEKFFSEPPGDIVYYLDYEKIYDLNFYNKTTGYNRQKTLPKENNVVFL